MSSSRPGRIFLSPPHLTGTELQRLAGVLESNWVAPLGPEVDRFEEEVAALTGRGHGAATNSGTAALHLALRLAGVGPGDEVVMPTLTFVASANAACYLGARPVFLDVSPDTWTLDPDLLAECLTARAASGHLPRAVLSVDLYGQCSDYDRIAEICRDYDVRLIVDAAEALGASYRGRPAGSCGEFAVFSFNGNKIITTGGGGMLVGDDGKRIAQARSLAAQARVPATHYEHVDMGYNYRLSNLLAAVGRAQLEVLSARVARRQQIGSRYRRSLAGVPGVSFMPRADYGVPSEWLTVMRLGDEARCAPRQLIEMLESEDIEARPAWKPMHLQPLFASAERIGGSVSESIFRDSLCLPSGSSLTYRQQTRVIELVGGGLGMPAGRHPARSAR